MRVDAIGASMTMVTTPTATQARALSLLGVDAGQFEGRRPVRLPPARPKGPGRKKARQTT